VSAFLPCFKTYDIRGTVPDQINPEVAYRIGRAEHAWGGAEEIVLGRDARHGPDTLRPENPRALRKAVIAEEADLGLMFDGDADRITFVDERGEIVPPDLVLMLLAREKLARRPRTVFHGLRFSRTVAEEIEKLGGRPVMMRVGNPFHKQALHQSGDALLAVELSGHIMYREHYGIDDPVLDARRAQVLRELGVE
jgi:phosphomannomutase